MGSKNKHNNFDVQNYLQHLAERLIGEYAFANNATTPGLKGGAREFGVAEQLKLLLPAMVGVGSGCVIDSYGNTSRQIDIVIYEKDLCPRFSINGDPATTYFPCEGVIAVGEVKSTVNTKELKDIIQKIQSVKSLVRHNTYLNGPEGEKLYNFRNFVNNQNSAIVLADGNQFNPKRYFCDQIFGFGFCGDIGVKTETIINNFIKEIKPMDEWTTPNIITFLNHGFLSYLKEDQTLSYFRPEAVGAFLTSKKEENFQHFITVLREVIMMSRTVPVEAYGKYFAQSLQETKFGGLFAKL